MGAYPLVSVDVVYWTCRILYIFHVRAGHGCLLHRMLFFWAGAQGPTVVRIHGSLLDISP